MSTDPTEVPADPGNQEDPRGLERMPGLAAVAATATVHAGGWALAQSVRASKRMAGAMTSPAKAAVLAGDVVSGTREAFTALGGLADGPSGGPPAAAGPTGAAGTSSADAPSASAEGAVDAGPSDSPSTERRAAASSARQNGEAQLRLAGEDLLRRSREVDDEPAIHPAYEGILTELTPDEGRMLRLMVLSGPQPSVDVQTGGILGFVSPHIIKRGLTMLGARAGLRYTDQVPAYLNNLIRLGLVWYSPETIRGDYQRYQVLEAQPDVEAAMDSVRRARVVRRSIHLTPFGEDFCRTCFSAEATATDDLPSHSAPKRPVSKAPGPTG